jgi:hypothetical protein
VTVATAERTCEVCGESIDHLRADATSCGSSCRGRRFRIKCPPCGWCSKPVGPGRRYGSKFCSAACERADTELHIATERARKTAMTVSVGQIKARCPTCGGRAPGRDEDANWVCVGCSRPMPV